MSANYGQFCPVAKASEIFAARWTPLIVRELIAGAHSFNDIHRGVPLISRAVLVARLRELEHQGVIERQPRAGGKGREYCLTPAGEGLRAVIVALGQWGMTYTHDRIKRSDLDPALLIWGLRRRVDVNTLPDRRVVLRFEFSGVPASRTKFRIIWLILGRSSVDVCIDGDHKIARAFPVWMQLKRYAAGMLQPCIWLLGLFRLRPIIRIGCRPTLPECGLESKIRSLNDRAHATSKA
jgi:DNA-binding HxlR family transcriptional regulator